MSIFKISLTLAFLLGSAACTHLFYQPTDELYISDPENLDKYRQEVSFASHDGTKLAGWWLHVRKGAPRGVIVQFHGNAQNMTAHFKSLQWLTDQGYELFTFDYRGYGISEGKPSEEGLNWDGQAAIRYALDRVPFRGGPQVVLYGQSLGGAVLMRAYDDITEIERKDVRAMVIESSFYSYHDIARAKLAQSWLTYILQPLAYILVSDAFSPEDSIPRISPTPLLVIHGDQDPVVPLPEGQKIFELAKQPKEFYLVPGGGHLVATKEATEALRARVLEFIKP